MHTRLVMAVRALAALLIALFVVSFATGLAWAQNTATPSPTLTQTPTVTATMTKTPSQTPTVTPTATKTPTGNTTLESDPRGAHLPNRGRVREQLNGSSPGTDVKLGDMTFLATRQYLVQATNATVLKDRKGKTITDIGIVTSVFSTVVSSGTPAPAVQRFEGVDYTLSNGTITPVGNHSTEIWTITYRP